MLHSFLTKMFGSRNDRLLKRYHKIVGRINELEATLSPLSDEELTAKTQEFRGRLEKGETLDGILPEAFAVVREASKRALGLRHFDVQMIGGLSLHEGKIAEMRTGEGKTLMATLPAYLNAISGRGVHIVTVNDYLAKRDSEWMRPVYAFLGMTVGVIYPDMEKEDKRDAYGKDITYGTNNEFGFDYLRDNMAFHMEGKFQRELNFAVVDEVDSILIDEARTPLIISGAAEDSSELYRRINRFIPQLKVKHEEVEEGDFSLDEKQKQVTLTEDGHQHIEELLIKYGLIDADESLYSAKNVILMHHVNAALRAHHLFTKDVDYIVKNNEVVIVDEHTGRTMPGRRWSDGLHQAVEAKEGVNIQSENQTLASITFQNFFRLYDKLAGMTGTADTEAYEFQQIYGLEVVVIPTNKPMVRDDKSDLIYLTKTEKYLAVIDDIKECSERAQPVLVGTASIEASELLSRLLNKEKVPHQVLNAKFHKKEAEIIAQAGSPGAVTIATNMAGRGTDIVLGGNIELEIKKLNEEGAGEEAVKALEEQWKENHAKVISAGGLRVIGSERHESRRIDNQLRGRSGRQGDPGSSRFYLSMEDDLMRIFASERVAQLMKRLGMEEGEAIEHPWVTKAIENAQRKVEGRNFDIRKQLLEYDDVANEQRKVIYQQRNEILAEDDISDIVEGIRSDVISQTVSEHILPESLEEQWDLEGLQSKLASEFDVHLDLIKWLDENESNAEEEMREYIQTSVDDHLSNKYESVDKELMQSFEKSLMLQVIDIQWREHLSAMEHMRQGIHLRGYAQKDPKQEYKRESFHLFEMLLGSIKHKVISTLCQIQLQDPEQISDDQPQAQSNLIYQHEDASAMSGAQEGAVADNDSVVTTFVRDAPKVGRNDPCSCGSGKKYKQCHGKLN